MARNKYAGDCYKCGLRVEVGTGHFERVRGMGWQVQHALHPGSGAVTCSIAAVKSVEDDHEQQKAEVSQFGCIR